MFGIVCKTRFVALMVTCLVAAIAATSALAHTTVGQAQLKTSTLAPQISKLDCTKAPAVHAFNLITCAFTTNVPAKTVIAEGTTSWKPADMVSLSDNRFRTTHSLSFVGVMPNMKYNVLVKVTDKSGKSSRPATTVVTTAAPGFVPKGSSTPVRADLRISKRNILLNGLRVFLLIADSYACPTPDDVRADRGMGFIVVDGPNGCGSDPTSEMQDAQVLHGMLAGKAWYMPTNPYAPAAPGLQGLPELLMWPGGINAQTILPNGSCSIPAFDKQVGKLYSNLVQTANVKPVAFSANITAYPNEGRANCYNAASVLSLLWGVSQAGVGATRLVTTPQWNTSKGVLVSPGVAGATATFSKEMAAFAPVLLYGHRLDISPNVSGMVQAAAWVYGGVTYVAVDNLGTVSAKQVTTVPGIGETGEAQQMFGAHHVVKVRNGSIADTYPVSTPVRIYKIVKK